MKRLFCKVFEGVGGIVAKPKASSHKKDKIFKIISTKLRNFRQEKRRFQGFVPVDEGDVCVPLRIRERHLICNNQSKVLGTIRDILYSLIGQHPE